MTNSLLTGSFPYKTDEVFANELDFIDPLSTFRSQFAIPIQPNKKEKIYFCGNSLGLQPVSVSEIMRQELERWQTLAVEAHFVGENSWYNYQEPLRDNMMIIVGAYKQETILMNSLTVNLHLLLFSFYQPTAKRFKILMMDPAFPSDQYAIKSFLAVKGYSAQNAIITWSPQNEDYIFSMTDLEDILQKNGEEIALIWLEGVNYLTGQAIDIARITQLGQQYGCKVGFDLAHAVGNIMLNLHDWQVDFAVWCSYKYLNGGPGAMGGCFVHEKHVAEPLLQLAGWWGNDPQTRFKFDSDFNPYPGVERWQISNPSIFAMAPLKASLKLFTEATMPALIEKSHRLTHYFRFLLESLEMKSIEIITPHQPNTYGCQLSLLISENANELQKKLAVANLVCDFREPNILRLAPVPLYNTYHDVWQAISIIKTQHGI